MSKEEQIEKIRNKILLLGKSPLYKFRVAENNQPVIGAGSLDATIMFIGEAPGRNEAKTGIPFCGAAGKVFDELLKHVGLSREEIYITNIVNDRPPKNRDPHPDEIKLYAPFLEQQINIIQPKVLATLGRYSMNYIMDKFGLAGVLEPIGKAHGKVFSVQAAYGTVTIIPLYHPAVAVYNIHTKGTLKKDFEILKQFKS